MYLHISSKFLFSSFFTIPYLILLLVGQADHSVRQGEKCPMHRPSCEENSAHQHIASAQHRTSPQTCFHHQHLLQNDQQG